MGLVSAEAWGGEDVRRGWSVHGCSCGEGLQRGLEGGGDTRYPRSCGQGRRADDHACVGSSSKHCGGRGGRGGGGDIFARIVVGFGTNTEAWRREECMRANLRKIATAAMVVERRGHGARGVLRVGSGARGGTEEDACCVRVDGGSRRRTARTAAIEEARYTDTSGFRAFALEVVIGVVYGGSGGEAREGGERARSTEGASRSGSEPDERRRVLEPEHVESEEDEQGGKSSGRSWRRSAGRAARKCGGLTRPSEQMAGG
ncbi:hypothetical protein DFH09DRAFT_1099732 [Mycena vulgaris]|nr:hypothetical protein DFH09DRAFT_1099732 [Mycena vulgaris]